MIGAYTGINPLKRFTRNLAMSDFYGHTDLRQIQLYTFSFESELAKNVYQTEGTMQKIGLMYLHSWLLCHHLKHRNHTAAGHFLSNERPTKLNNILRMIEFKILLDLLIKTEHVFIFSNEFSREIHDELKRTKRTLWAGMDMHQIGRADLSDLIYFHVLMENASEDEVARLTEHVQKCL